MTDTFLGGGNKTVGRVTNQTDRNLKHKGGAEI